MAEIEGSVNAGQHACLGAKELRQYTMPLKHLIQAMDSSRAMVAPNTADKELLKGNQFQNLKGVPPCGLLLPISPFPLRKAQSRRPPG